MNRRLVVAALVALLAFSLVGCGGGGEEQPAETPTDQAAVPPPAPVTAPGAEGDAAIADRSVEESITFEPFPTGEFVPVEIRKRLQAKPKQPMLLFFFDDDQLETDDARIEINAAVKENRGSIDLISYDLGEFTSIDDKGRASVVDTDSLSADEKGKQVIELARELDVSFTPYVILVDDQGYMIFRWRGYISSEMLGRQIARTKGSKS